MARALREVEADSPLVAHRERRFATTPPAVLVPVEHDPLPAFIRPVGEAVPIPIPRAATRNRHGIGAIASVALHLERQASAVVRGVPVDGERQPLTIWTERIADDSPIKRSAGGVLVVRLRIGARVPSLQPQIEPPVRSQTVMLEPCHPDGVLPVATGRLAKAPAVVGGGEVDVERAANGGNGEPQVEPRDLVRFFDGAAAQEEEEHVVGAVTPVGRRCARSSLLIEIGEANFEWCDGSTGNPNNGEHRPGLVAITAQRGHRQGPLPAPKYRERTGEPHGTIETEP